MFIIVATFSETLQMSLCVKALHVIKWHTIIYQEMDKRICRSVQQTLLHEGHLTASKLCADSKSMLNSKSLIVLRKIYINNFFQHGAWAPNGPRPPRYQGFITTVS